MNRLIAALLVFAALLVPTLHAEDSTALTYPLAVAFAPGHYLHPAQMGIPLLNIQPVNVTIDSADATQLSWNIAVFASNGVYQGAMKMPFGLVTDIPLTAKDYDGDGYDDPAVWRASDQTIYVLRSGCPGGQNFWGCSYALFVP